MADRIVVGEHSVKRVIMVIVVAALLGSLAFDLTGSSEISYIVRSITRVLL